ncbi:DUF4375 domain-containing protein [uncultured Rubinisphaera sp.]|uniref:DMP19 family protein n=1 Tax=uncultured Rubinisphaera sp. TaxID=1678686 RepID=UPI0030DDDE36|tara:strand:- start:22 stop:510 length:489 start_codon:yes stop_codon:yes gene_type:complete
MNIGEVVSQNGVDYDNAFLEYLDNCIGENAGADQIAAWESLPQMFRQYHALFALDSEQFNGGFNQYFARYSSYAPMCEAALDGLKLVSADKHHELALEAVSIFVHYFPNLQTVMEQRSISESPKLTETDIDHRFQAAGDLQELRLKWLDASRTLIQETAKTE